jgi:N-acetylglucosamine repressor
VEDRQNVKISSNGDSSKKGGRDLQYLRTNNLWALLSAIWDHGPVSRFDLSHITGLAPSSVTRLIRTLTDLGLIIETGKGESSGGRIPTLIVPNPQAGLVISLDLSGTHMRGGLFDAANNLINGTEQPFSGLGPEAIKTQILDLIHSLLDKANSGYGPLLGIGVSFPGVTDLVTGDIKESSNLRLYNFPLRKILSSEFNLPVYAEKDANVAALAEHYYGAGRGMEHLVYVLVSTGIGAGIISDGQLFRGETGQSGEFGHIILDPGGLLCVCGKRGCLEAMAAVPAMLSGARWMLMHGRASLLSDLIGDDLDSLSIGMIGQAAQMGDSIAKDILINTADYLARGITILASLVDIRHIIIGGEVAETGEVFFAPLQQSLDKYRRDSYQIEVIPAELKQNTFLRGISMLTLQDLLLKQVQQMR